MNAALEELQPRAQAALANSPFHELRTLQVQPRGGAMCISGCVTSFYHKQLAQEVVRSICADAELVNTIEVKGEPDESPQGPLPVNDV
ncbi:MAG: BON domain-containing protein [Thermoguttaceae bacterium]